MRLIKTSIIIVLLCMITNCALFAQHNFVSSTLPIHTQALSDTTAKIAGIHGSVGGEKVYLDWTVENNENADKFEVERSTDGKHFVMAALVFGTNKKGTDQYWFFEKKKEAPAYYRVKIIRMDGTASYSAVNVVTKQKAVNE